MKNLPIIHTVSRFLAVSLLCIVSWCAVSCASQSSSYSPEGMAFIAGMGYGWNIGNTFDALPNGNVRRAGLETENADKRCEVWSFGIGSTAPFSPM